MHFKHTFGTISSIGIMFFSMYGAVSLLEDLLHLWKHFH